MKMHWIVAGATVAYLSLTGCVAPLLVGAAAGAGVFGAGEGTSALMRRENAREARLRHISAAAMGVTPPSIATISDRDYRGGILHWAVTLQDGRQFNCQEGAGTAMCNPVTP